MSSTFSIFFDFFSKIVDFYSRLCYYIGTWRYKTMMNLVEFGKRIRDRRTDLDMTQEELAKRAGYTSRSSINKIELGLVDLPQSKILAIANALGVTPAWLLGWDNSNSGVNNGIIGNQNSNNTIIVEGKELEANGEIESELLALCKKMTVQQKAKLLTFATELLEG